MATWRGATALGRGEQTGSLAANLAADIVAVDMSAIRHKPLYDPASQLLHTTSGPSVSHVWIDGDCLLDDYRLTRMDEAEISRTAVSWQRRIRPR